MRGIAAYQKTRKQTASPTQIVLMLFQTAVERLERANDPSRIGTAEWVADLHRVREIYLELLSALDEDAAPELVPSLRSLYQWSINQLIAAGRDRTLEPIQDVLKTTTSMAEAWQHAVYSGEAR
ncbi:MAG: flagellar protein FliS [Deltaproteobacteria bacterium]|nr:flagellar protein FliS [Deltaproteobacteria bacterium]